MRFRCEWVLSIFILIPSCVPPDNGATPIGLSSELSLVTKTSEVSCDQKGQGELVQELFGYTLSILGPVGIDDAGFLQVSYAISSVKMTCPFVVVSSLSANRFADGRRNVYLDTLADQQLAYEANNELGSAATRARDMCERTYIDRDCPIDSLGVSVVIQNMIIESKLESFAILDGVVFKSDGSIYK